VIDLRTSLASAIAWCDEHADPARPRDSLRSLDLMPSLFAAERAWTVEGVITRRTRLVGPLGRRARTGRLLVCFPDGCLDDCAAEHSANGYFDGGDVPP
jgi:hypothetical protein